MNLGEYFILVFLYWFSNGSPNSIGHHRENHRRRQRMVVFFQFYYSLVGDGNVANDENWHQKCWAKKWPLLALDGVGRPDENQTLNLNENEVNKGNEWRRIQDLNQF